MACHIVLFDDFVGRTSLLPLVATRPVGNLRVGVLTIDQKWASIFKASVSYITTPHLTAKFPLMETLGYTVLVINAAVLPSEELVSSLKNLETNQVLLETSGDWIAAKLASIQDFSLEYILALKSFVFRGSLMKLKYPEDIFLLNEDQIAFDIKIMDIDKTDASTVPDACVLGENLYLRKRVTLSGATLDCSKGPIFIGGNTLVEPGAVLYGPIAIGENCRIKAGAVLYPNVTIGDHSVVNGELNNVVIWGRSSKGHGGYLGCSVLGEGCNLGAGTVNSNLRNDWNTVSLYDYSSKSFRDTNLSKCGVIIGDYVMLGILSKINTGTVIGVGAQIAISKIIPKFVPDFSWYTDENQETYILDRFVRMIHRKSEMKHEKVDSNDIPIWEFIHAQTKELRK